MASEDRKRRSVKVATWTSWLAALGMTAWITTQPVESSARQYSLLIVLLIGVAIRLGQESSRYKLGDTIVAALKTGYNLSEEHAKIRVDAAEAMASERHEEAMKQAREEIAKQEAERLRVQNRNQEEDDK
jgi:hypothetical protein